MNDANDNGDEGLPSGPGQVEQSPTRGHLTRATDELLSDRGIGHEIDGWLAARGDFDPQHVQALVEGGVVVLLGELPDDRAKRRLEEFLLTLPGVREVRDQLLVSGDVPATEPRPPVASS